MACDNAACSFATYSCILGAGGPCSRALGQSSEAFEKEAGTMCDESMRKQGTGALSLAAKRVMCVTGLQRIFRSGGEIPADVGTSASRPRA